MGDGAAGSSVLDPSDEAVAADDPPPHARTQRLLEALAVLASPAALFFALRISPMSPYQGPDASMHTTYIVDPSAMFARYTAYFTPTARLREAARVGFLVPARIDYLLFGALPGFYVTRYLFALVAIVPTYLLLRRLYSRSAGALGIVVVMTCPVVLTAWGSDYPDSAVVSYSAGALACLAMPSSGRGRRGWIAAAAALLTLAVWAHGVGALLAASTFACYGLVRLLRDRRHLLGDAALVVGVAVVVTAALSVGSELLLGHFNFIQPTWASFRYLSQPAQIAEWHSSNWHWAPRDAFLLVPPALVVAYAAVFLRRRGGIQTAHWIVGTAFAAQVLVYWLMQFVGNLWILEFRIFSSTLWGSTCVAMAVLLAEVARPLLERPATGWLAPAAAVGVALAYEADPHVPILGWAPYGFFLVGCIVVIAGAARLARRLPAPAAWLSATAAVVAIAGAALVLTVAKQSPLPHQPGIVSYPDPQYAAALGGRVATSGSFSLVDQYQVTTELPGWVGPPAYSGEQLFTWWPASETTQLWGPIGIYHGGINQLYSTLGARTLAPLAQLEIKKRDVAQILIFSMSGDDFAAGVRALGPYLPVVAKRGVLSYGSSHLHVWLVDLGRS